MYDACMTDSLLVKRKEKSMSSTHGCSFLIGQKASVNKRECPKPFSFAGSVRKILSLEYDNDTGDAMSIANSTYSLVGRLPLR